jgi:hypothetical protein
MERTTRPSRPNVEDDAVVSAGGVGVGVGASAGDDMAVVKCRRTCTAGGQQGIRKDRPQDWQGTTGGDAGKTKMQRKMQRKRKRKKRRPWWVVVEARCSGGPCSLLVTGRPEVGPAAPEPRRQRARAPTRQSLTLMPMPSLLDVDAPIGPPCRRSRTTRS